MCFPSKWRLTTARSSADEEHESGIRAIGVPVLDLRGVAVAALSTAAPAFRTELDSLLQYLPTLRDAAKELATNLPS